MENETEGPLQGIKGYLVLLAVLWTLVIASFLIWDGRGLRQETLDGTIIEARAAYEKDVLYRRWNTMHGGVYVPVTGDTPPNPYLDVPERDISTPSGRNLTLMNPAYMTRQVHELSENQTGIRGHITSLNPIRSQNAPDPWEAAALTEFETGVEEVSSVEYLDGQEYMRLMRPLITEEGCLKCHGAQGYKVGDVRGGISVAVPMEPHWALYREQLRSHLVGHGLIWLVGMVGILIGGRRLIRSEEARERAQRDIERHVVELEEANYMKDLFTDIMRHDLLNPAGNVRTSVEYLLELEKDETKKDVLDVIHRSASRLIDMIDSASLYSKLQSFEEVEREEMDLNTVLKTCLEETGYLFEKAGMEVDYLHEGDYPIMANPMVEDVFMNLLSNAAKYAAEGGRVEIGIRDDDTAWVVHVTDWGSGISPEFKEKLFTRFQRRNKEGVKGTGLGLAIAKRIVDLHGGRIWVEDNPEGGSIFYVMLPKG